MTNENFHTLSLHSKLKKTKSWVTLVAGTLFSVILIGFQAGQFINTLATKNEIEEIKANYSLEHVKLKQELLLERTKLELEIKSLQDIKYVVIDHLEKHVGRLASERTSDKRKAAKAAEIARKKFREALALGKTIEEALLDSYDSFPL